MIHITTQIELIATSNIFHLFLKITQAVGKQNEMYLFIYLIIITWSIVASWEYAAKCETSVRSAEPCEAVLVFLPDIIAWFTTQIFRLFQPKKLN